MNTVIRPLPATIAVIALLTGVKTFDLAKNIGIGTPALASTPPGEQKPAPTKPAAQQLSAPSDKTKPQGDPGPSGEKNNAAPDGCGEPVTESERATLQDLRGRRKQLDARAAQLDEREAVLGAAEKRVTDRIQQLATLEGKLENLDKQRKEREEANWQGLVKTYETMKPRDAATIFDDLDDSVLVQVLDRMKAAKAAPILAAMSPERARAATLQLAKYRQQITAPPQVDAPVPSAK